MKYPISRAFWSPKSTGPDGRRRANTFLRQTIEGMYCHVFAVRLLIISCRQMHRPSFCKSVERSAVT
ncbi:hypothetical protein KCP74_11705 [Salmonella enterica subsp. enterica]|nr:hypothetical protein KCP74_11705 [Salmonella enterica subsp. enterica]